MGKAEFKKEIGVFGGVSIIAGIMIGSGIFYLGSYVLERSGFNLGLSLLAWLAAGLISLLGGLCYAELGAANPKAGGMVVYLNEAYGPAVGYMAGFTDWLVGGPGSIAAISIAFMSCMESFFDISEFGIKLGAAVIITGLTVYNIFGVKRSNELQSLSMVLKLIPLLVIMFAALFAGTIAPDLSLGSAVHAASDGALTVAEQERLNAISMEMEGRGFSEKSFFSALAFATVAALWAYEGWNNLNIVAEEIKDPRRSIPRAFLIGIGGVTVLYTLFNFAIYRVLSLPEMMDMIGSGDLYLGTAAAVKIFGKAGGTLVALAMLLSMFGSLNGMIFTFPREQYAMAKEGGFFEAFGRLHPRYSVPHVGLIVQAGLSLVLVFLRSLDQLTDMVVLTTMLFNILVVLALPVLRKRNAGKPRPYSIPLYPASVYFTLMFMAALLVATAIEDPVTGLIGFIVPLLGFVCYKIKG